MALDEDSADQLTAQEEQALQSAIVSLNARAWGLGFGLLAGGGLFIATAILVIRGGAAVGPHLGLLGIYLRGYEVTWPGAVVGLIYGFVLGYFAGWSVSVVYNRLAKIG